MESVNDEIVGVTVEEEVESKAAEASKTKGSKLMQRVAADKSHATELAQLPEVQPEELTASIFEKPDAPSLPDPKKRSSDPSLVNLIAAEPAPSEGAGGLMAEGELPEDESLEH